MGPAIHSNQQSYQAGKDFISVMAGQLALPRLAPGEERGGGELIAIRQHVDI